MQLERGPRECSWVPWWEGVLGPREREQVRGGRPAAPPACWRLACQLLPPARWANGPAVPEPVRTQAHLCAVAVAGSGGRRAQQWG